MSNLYNVSIHSITEVHSLEGIWNDASLTALLALADADDFADLKGDDLLEMTLMVLQDMGNQKAGELILEAVFGNQMRPGVRQNLVDDLQQDEPWSDFADVLQQRGIFITVVLLHKAFPNHYGTPVAQILRASVQAKAPAGLTAMESASQAWLLRLLACGMDDSNIVQRIYADDLKAGSFNSAAGLLWDYAKTASQPPDNMTRTFSVTASAQLLRSLDIGQIFKATVI
jgi:hypothetical protein